MAKNTNTVAALRAHVDAEFLSIREESRANHAQIMALLSGSAEAAVVKAPKAPKVTAPVEPKAPVGKVFRSAKGKEAAKVAVDKAWADAKDKAGVKRVKDLTPKQRAAVDAQVKAIWAAVPKTRSTKA